jgi:hypothetical protein
MPSVEAMKRDMETGFDALRGKLRSEIAAVRKESEAQCALLRKDMETQGSQIVIRLGALIVVMAGLILGAMQLGA